MHVAGVRCLAVGGDAASARAEVAATMGPLRHLCGVDDVLCFTDGGAATPTTVWHMRAARRCDNMVAPILWGLPTSSRAAARRARRRARHRLISG